MVCFDHEKLDAYQVAIELVVLIDEIIERLPRGRAYLADQLQRAGTSIPLNIAEGAGNSSVKEFSRFLDYAIRSGFECIGCADIALENEFIQEPCHREIGLTVNEIIAMLDGLQKSLTR